MASVERSPEQVWAEFLGSQLDSDRVQWAVVDRMFSETSGPPAEPADD